MMKRTMAGVAVLGLSIAAFPIPNSLLTDAAHVLSAADAQRIEQTLRDYEAASTNQFAVVTVASLDGMTIEEYANKFFHQVGIGQKKQDNGLLLLISVRERKIRFEVGYGLEGALPDGRAGQIIRENIVPKLRTGDWAGGITDGVAAAITQLQSQASTISVPPVNTSNDHFLFVVGAVILGLILVIAALILMFEKNDKDDDDDTNDAASIPRVPYVPVAYVPPVSHSHRVVSEPDDPPRPSRRDDDDDYHPSSSSYGSSSSDSGGGFGGFGGGDSGGGGASGSF